MRGTYTSPVHWHVTHHFGTMFVYCAWLLRPAICRKAHTQVCRTHKSRAERCRKHMLHDAELNSMSLIHEHAAYDPWIMIRASNASALARFLTDNITIPPDAQGQNDSHADCAPELPGICDVNLVSHTPNAWSGGIAKCVVARHL